MRKWVISLLAAMCLLSVLPGRAQAHPVPEMDRGGQIHVALHHRGQALEGGSLTFYRAAGIEKADGDYRYSLTEAFAPSGVPLEDLQAPVTAEALAAWAEAQELPGARVPNAGGQVTFPVAQGQLGLYLVVQDEACDGFAPIAPFLVGVPLPEEGRYLYEVEAAPKMGELTPEKPETPEKPDEEPRLPQTGQLNWPVPVLAGGGLVLFMLGWALRRSGKRDGHES